MGTTTPTCSRCGKVVSALPGTYTTHYCFAPPDPDPRDAALARMREALVEARGRLVVANEADGQALYAIELALDSNAGRAYAEAFGFARDVLAAIVKEHGPLMVTTRDVLVDIRDALATMDVVSK